MVDWYEFNDELSEYGRAPLAFGAYLTSGHCIEAVFENGESEFLQMGLYVLLTVWLVQKGSSESKSLSELEEVDQSPSPTQKGPMSRSAQGLGADTLPEFAEHRVLYAI